MTASFDPSTHVNYKDSNRYLVQLKPSELYEQEFENAKRIALSNSTLLELINTQPFEFSERNSFLGDPKTGKWKPLLYININNETTASVLVSLEDEKVLKISTVDRIKTGGVPSIDQGKIWGNVAPPLNQIRQGIEFHDIICKNDLVLIKKIDDSPACVKPKTADKLIKRGWAKPVHEIEW